ncbi:hypothetical protein FSP39_011855 [Pinctada imbricata]|uniref:Uncharacterized protein n=1 Tax=Pinctada imbricata TaxID=66713 RepID=A0AA88XRM7_PINIB|nr:hypothetical protein FSP39_011855 [Pinctada imbricata]
MHQPSPTDSSGVVHASNSSDDRQDDSVFESSDRFDEDLEFSDSVASPIKMNWQRDSNQENVPWHNDTSPSDNFELEESFVGSNSFDHSPSETSLSSHNLLHLSPNENSSASSEMKVGEGSKSSDFFSDVNILGQRKEIPVDAFLNNVGRTSSQDSNDHLTSQGASG